MAVRKIKKSRKFGLIKKDAPHPKYPAYKFDSAHLTDREADKAEHDLLDNPRVDATRRIHVPSQHLVYKHLRITPKRPKLRR